MMNKKFRGICALLIGFGFLSWQNSFAQVKISEVAWMGTQANSYDEWIELYNASSREILLDNWVLQAADLRPTINLKGKIPAKSYFLLERTDDSTVSSQKADQIYIGGLSNQKEILILQNNKGEIVDQTPPDGWSAGENSAKKTMERKNFTISGKEKNAWQTFQNTNSDFFDAKNNPILGTPRAQNSGKIIFPTESPNFISDFTKTEISEFFPDAETENSPILNIKITTDAAVDVTDWQIQNEEKIVKLSDIKADLIILNQSENLAGKSVFLNQNGKIKASEQTENAPNFVVKKDKLVFLPAQNSREIILGIPRKFFTLHKNSEFKIINKQETEITKKVFAKDLQILISEFPTQSKQTPFLELFIKTADEKINLKGLKIYHNGQNIFTAKNDLWVQDNDYFVLELHSKKLQKRKFKNTTILRETGLQHTWQSSRKNKFNRNSGTIEVVWNGQTEDFICWFNKNLSKTENRRVAKNSPKNWQNQCLKIKKQRKNYIFRSEPITDTNTVNDFLQSFRNTAGQPNLIKNKKPQARIKIQQKSFYKELAKLNLTGFAKDGSASFDSDGNEDLTTFQWEINGQNCGTLAKDGWEWQNSRENIVKCWQEASKKNPYYLLIDFAKIDEIEIKLTVFDRSFARGETTILLNKKNFLKPPKPQPKTAKYFPTKFAEKPNENFFADFLATTDLVKLKKQAYAQNLPKSIPPARRYLFLRDKFSPAERKLIAKNIGLIYSK